MGAKWQSIETAGDPGEVLLWNGLRVFPGWLDDDGWHDSRNRDHDDEPEDPQPDPLDGISRTSRPLMPTTYTERGMARAR